MKININNIEYISIDEFEILKSYNSHDRCKINLNVKGENALNLFNLVSKELKISYKNIEVFNGMVEDVELYNTQHKTNIIIYGSSYSTLEDVKKEEKIFQNPKKTYGDIINELNNNSNGIQYKILDNKVKSKVIEIPIIQDETNFLFIKRLVSIEGLGILASNSGDAKTVAIGKWGNPKYMSYDKSNYILKRNKLNCYLNIKLEGNEINEILDLTDMIKFQGEKYCINQVKCTVEDGIFYIEYSFFQNLKVEKQNLIIKNIEGKVIDNIDPESLGRVQVEFKNEVESEERYWFLILSFYSANGVGFSFIPELEEKVSVHIDENSYVEGIIREKSDEKIHVNAKVIANAFGKEISFYEKGIKIVSVVEKIGLIMSEEKISIQNNETFMEISENEIILVTPKSSIKLGEEIEIISNKIVQKGSSGKLTLDKNIEINGSTVKIKGSQIELS